MDLLDVSFPLPGSSEIGRGRIAKPAGDGPHPAVLVLHELFGLNSDIERITAEFANAGYVALAPDYFGEGFKLKCVVSAFRTLQRGEGAAFLRLQAAQDWLCSQPDVDGDRVGVAGFCMGGSFAVLHAVRSDVSAVAMFYGEVPKDHSALKGIPPCIAGFGGQDKLFASGAERLEAHLNKLEVPVDVVSYADAGHSFMSHHEGTLAAISAKGPMKVGYNPEAAADSWERMLSFFGEHVAS